MTVICAWCKSTIDERGDALITDICKRCISSINSDRSLKTFINDIPVPIVVLDKTLAPICSNNAGMDRYRVAPGEAKDCRLGEVVECNNATLPGGCGHTVHCLACELRRSVGETNSTGNRAYMVPVTINSGSERVDYYVSTVKVGDCVVVKLDDADGSR